MILQYSNATLKRGIKKTQGDFRPAAGQALIKTGSLPRCRAGTIAAGKSRPRSSCEKPKIDFVFMI
jgi:hypothetical protein